MGSSDIIFRCRVQGLVDSVKVYVTYWGRRKVPTVGSSLVKGKGEGMDVS